MTDTILAADKFIAPLIGFKFHVAFVRSPIRREGGSRETSGDEALCEGAFAEVTGLEVSMEPKAIKEGGLNYGAHQRAGQVTFSTVVLKRGVTTARDLWAWWQLFAGAATKTDNPETPKNGALAHRLLVRITQMDAAGRPQIVWRLERAMPVKFKAPDFNAKAGEVGIEELHFVHEGLFAEAPPPAPSTAAPTGGGR
ncbi:MAG TPA: phage tail protein [Burkholderiaceae bacterium]|nr:phage tail protein [Burkholderiaceae bacterium]